MSEAEADFLVTHTVTVETRTQVQKSPRCPWATPATARTVGLGSGMVSRSSPRFINTRSAHWSSMSSTLQKRLSGAGSGERTLGEDQTPEKRTETINTTVNEVLGRFPPPGKKPR
ncbi:MAG: hypothetical protein MZV65_44965 [Chromatiales bacterium]|nr:hypothetical protein [Chromatiales bacterium]